MVKVPLQRRSGIIIGKRVKGETQEVNLLRIDETDIKILKALHEIKEPVGLDNLAVRLNESTKVLSETIEPYLIQRGLILRGSRGRRITSEGRKYLRNKGYIEEKRLKKRNIPKSFDRGL